MTGPAEGGRPRAASVAGTFYPADPRRLRALVDELLVVAGRTVPRTRAASPADERSPAPGGDATPSREVVGLLVPHAGLAYSGAVAAAVWRTAVGTAGEDDSRVTTVVLLGTNHRAAWLDGVGVWDRGAWQTPLGVVAVDAPLAEAIAALGPPFVVDRDAHVGEHSIEVQLPFLAGLAPAARIVPLAVSAGTGRRAIQAGARLGALLAGWRTSGRRIIVAVSSDMAHYPAAGACASATDELLPAILGLSPDELAARERALTRRRVPGLVCGMCGIQPAVMGLAALRAAGATAGVALAAATSADAGGPLDQTVGYLGVAFTR